MTIKETEQVIQWMKDGVCERKKLHPTSDEHIWVLVYYSEGYELVDCFSYYRKVVKQEQVTGFLNVYSISCAYFTSKQQADTFAQVGRLACIDLSLYNITYTA